MPEAPASGLGRAKNGGKLAATDAAAGGVEGWPAPPTQFLNMLSVHLRGHWHVLSSASSRNWLLQLSRDGETGQWHSSCKFPDGASEHANPGIHGRGTQWGVAPIMRTTPTMRRMSQGLGDPSKPKGMRE